MMGMGMMRSIMIVMRMRRRIRRGRRESWGCEGEVELDWVIIGECSELLY